MRHNLRAHPEGRLQCTACRAAFLTKESARLSVASCPEIPVAHGHQYEREHVLYPFSYTRGDGYGPDRLCDVIGCEQCVGHACDCDVCAQRLEIPSLRILMDNHDVGRARSINWEMEDMENDLKTKLAGVKHGDYVSASGVDTRGHKVTRVGFLLWEPKEVKAQRDGVSVKAWRVFVGDKSQDATDRSTWVTMFGDTGTIELLTADPAGIEWQDTELRACVSSAVILFGGKAGKSSKGPSKAVKVSVTYTDSGAYELRDLETRELVDTMRLQSRVWWAAMPDAHYKAMDADGFKAAIRGHGPALVEDDDEHQDQDETPDPEWQKRKMGDFVNWGNAPRYFRYGGLAKRKPKVDAMVRVRWAESRFGMNKLVDVHTNEVVDEVHTASKIWAVPATDEEIVALPPLVELPDARPDYSLPPEERNERLAVEEDQEEEEYIEPRKPIRSGVLFEGWLGERDETGGFKVWDNARRRVIGWLSADYTMFRPVGA